MCTTHEHDHGLSIIMKMAAVKSSQLGLFFFVTTLENRCQPIYYHGSALRCQRLKNKIKNIPKLIYTSDARMLTHH